jgi:hypothetical protein
MSSIAEATTKLAKPDTKLDEQRKLSGQAACAYSQSKGTNLQATQALNSIFAKGSAAEVKYWMGATAKDKLEMTSNICKSYEKYGSGGGDKQYAPNVGKPKIAVGPGKEIAKPGTFSWWCTLV